MALYLQTIIDFLVYLTPNTQTPIRNEIVRFTSDVCTIAHAVHIRSVAAWTANEAKYMTKLTVEAANSPTRRITYGPYSVSTVQLEKFTRSYWNEELLDMGLRRFNRRDEKDTVLRRRLVDAHAQSLTERRVRRMFLLLHGVVLPVSLVPLVASFVGWKARRAVHRRMWCAPLFFITNLRNGKTNDRPTKTMGEPLFDLATMWVPLHRHREDFALHLNFTTQTITCVSLFKDVDIEMNGLDEDIERVQSYVRRQFLLANPNRQRYGRWTVTSSKIVSTLTQQTLSKRDIQILQKVSPILLLTMVDLISDPVVCEMSTEATSIDLYGTLTSLANAKNNIDKLFVSLSLWSYFLYLYLCCSLRFL